jgi:phage baseplate assembly protein W
MTDQLATVENGEAVKQRIRNICLTTKGERPYSDLGTKLNSLLFELVDPLTAQLIQAEIAKTVRQNEPGVDELAVDVQTYQDTAYFVRVSFTLLNIPGENKLDLLLKKVR